MAGKPTWINSRPITQGQSTDRLREVLKELSLNTVCWEANCPNIGDCWAERTATFMILGKVCTRNCHFCDVKTGKPQGQINNAEPTLLKEACKRLDLEYMVLTSVDRDDLEDGGATHFFKSIQAVKELDNPPTIEALIPDFQAEESHLRTIAGSSAEVIGHNIETVARLTPQVRDPKASYQASLKVLKKIKRFNPNLITKSSLMMGLGETKPEIISTIRDLREAGVDILTIGQYLRPSPSQLPVEKFWDRDEFQELEKLALEEGFKAVIAGPFVRSSYKAKNTYRDALLASCNESTTENT